MLLDIKKLLFFLLCPFLLYGFALASSTENKLKAGHASTGSSISSNDSQDNVRECLWYASLLQLAEYPIYNSSFRSGVITTEWYNIDDTFVKIQVLIPAYVKKLDINSYKVSFWYKEDVLMNIDKRRASKLKLQILQEASECLQSSQ